MFCFINMVIKKQQMSKCEGKFVFIKMNEFMMLNKKSFIKESTREQIMAVLPIAKTRINYIVHCSLPNLFLHQMRNQFS